MKKYLLIALTFLATQSFAQENESALDDAPQGKNVSQTIEALKIAYITKELNLTQEEAQNFWPTYNAYSAEMKKLRQDTKDDVVAFEEKKVAVLKKYQEDFKRILNNDDRVKRCFKAEPEFHRILRKEWQRRQALKPKIGKVPKDNNQPNDGNGKKGGIGGGAHPNGPKPAHHP